MPITPDDVAMALDLRRGLRDWKKITPEEFKKAEWILRSTSDARLAQLVEAQKPVRQFYRFIHSPPLRRGT
jgi:hypothetical protein